MKNRKANYPASFKECYHLSLESDVNEVIEDTVAFYLVHKVDFKITEDKMQEIIKTLSKRVISFNVIDFYNQGLHCFDEISAISDNMIPFKSCIGKIESFPYAEYLLNGVNKIDSSILNKRNKRIVLIKEILMNFAFKVAHSNEVLKLKLKGYQGDDSYFDGFYEECSKEYKFNFADYEKYCLVHRYINKTKEMAEILIVDTINAHLDGKRTSNLIQFVKDRFTDYHYDEKVFDKSGNLACASFLSSREVAKFSYCIKSIDRFHVMSYWIQAFSKNSQFNYLGEKQALIEAIKVKAIELGRQNELKKLGIEIASDKKSPKVAKKTYSECMKEHYAKTSYGPVKDCVQLATSSDYKIVMQDAVYLHLETLFGTYKVFLVEAQDFIAEVHQKYPEFHVSKFRQEALECFDEIGRFKQELVSFKGCVGKIAKFEYFEYMIDGLKKAESKGMNLKKGKEINDVLVNAAFLVADAGERVRLKELGFVSVSGYFDGFYEECAKEYLQYQFEKYKKYCLVERYIPKSREMAERMIVDSIAVLTRVDVASSKFVLAFVKKHFTATAYEGKFMDVNEEPVCGAFIVRRDTDGFKVCVSKIDNFDVLCYWLKGINAAPYFAMQDRVSVILKEKLLIVANKVGRKGELEALGIHEHEHEHEHEEKKKEYRRNVMSNVKDLKENISTVLTIVVGAGVFIVVMVVVYVIWRNDKKMNTKRPPVIPFAMEMQG